IDVRAEPKGLAKGCANPAYDLAAARCVISEALLVDVAGNDTYGQMEAPEQGVDGLCTDDLLVRRVGTGGAGAWGAGILIDDAGADTYEPAPPARHGPGASGIVRDTGSMGFGDGGGFGLFLDGAGRDTYRGMPGRADGATVTPSGPSQGFFHDSGGG